MAKLTIAEAADTLGVAQSTIRKRLRSGDLQGQKVKGAGGFRWEVFVADGPTVKGDTQDGNHANVTDDGGALVVELKARVNNLEEQLTIRAGEISELHRLLAAHSLNPAQSKPWWAFWR